MKHTLWQHFGEFTMLVLGVLLALTMDGWVQEREERQLEQWYLVRLYEELEDQRSRFDRTICQSGHTLMQVGSLGRVLEGDDIDLVIREELYEHPFAVDVPGNTACGLGNPDPEAKRGLFRAGIVNLFSYAEPPAEFSSPTFEELIATGRLNLIRSDSVRVLLTDYRSSVRDWEVGRALELAAARASLQELILPMSPLRPTSARALTRSLRGPITPEMLQAQIMTVEQEAEILDRLGESPLVLPAIFEYGNLLRARASSFDRFSRLADVVMVAIEGQMED